MFFTKDDFKRIEDYLKLNSRRDSDFDVVESVTDDDTTVIVQGAENKSIKIGDLIASGMLDKSITMSKLADDIINRFILNEESAGELQDQIDALSAYDKTLLAILTRFQLRLDEIMNKAPDGMPHVVLSKSEYDALQHKDKYTIYLIVDKTWTFGNNFPIILSGDWKFGNQFPIRLK